MAVSRHGIVIEIIGDERGYIRAAESTIATNTKLDSSFKRVSVNAKASADAQIAAAVKASEAMRVNAVNLQAAATKLPAGSGRDAALVAAAAAQARYSRSVGVSTAESEKLSVASKTAERDVGKATRGLLAGSTAGLGFGRSLAFASAGFLSFFAGAKLLRDSITGAENLAKAQRGLGVAIQHTGGNVAALGPKYAATAKRAQEFGINQADATTGLERATLLTGDAAKAQRAYQEALVISKATGKDFNTVLTATSKGQEGITTSLQRYGIKLAKGTAGTEQFRIVMSRWAGQAKVNTTESERFTATLQNSEEIVGTALLPTFNRYIGELGDWLTRMQESGRLQKDVNGVLHVTHDVFHSLGDAIGIVDKVTGSFARTLEVLAAFKFASLVNGWIGGLGRLEGAWVGVGGAATTAGAAETTALAEGGAAVAAGAAGAAGASRIILPAGVAAGAAARGAGGASFGSRFLGRVTGIAGAVAGVFAIGDAGVEARPLDKRIVHKPNGDWIEFSRDGFKHIFDAQYLGFPGDAVITGQLRNFPRRGSLSPSFLQLPQGLQPAPNLPAPLPATTTHGGIFNFGLGPIFKSFQLTISEEIAQARASLTRSTTDDVAAAKQVIARIKRLTDEGHLSGASLVQALQAEATALGTIWSAEAAAAQKRSQAAAAARARIQKQIENSIDPLALEVQLSRDQALGKPTVGTLRALRAAAEKALASGKLSLAQQKEAYDQITSLNQQIKDQAANTNVTFTAPAKLQLALAKDQALGTDQTRDLLKLKRGILKFIRTHKKNIAAEIDAYNQLASVNQQLTTSTNEGLGKFKQASTKALTANVGLTEAQRNVLRARFSQLGPGGTVPGSGVGAAGFQIDPNTGRPIHVHTTVKLDGKTVARSTTVHQGRHNRRNPRQRRGPHAGDPAYG